MTEQQLRQQISDVCNKMWLKGWVAANDGNVSAKLDENVFLATPTGISKGDVTPDTLVLIDANGALLDKTSAYRPSSEIKMHLRCYKDRDDVTAVVHAHPPTATAFAVAHLPMDSYSMIEAVIMIGSIPIAPYATPSTDEVPESIAPLLPEHDVILLENHGAITVGTDLQTAYFRMETLEHQAKISLCARLLGGEYSISDENIKTLINMRGRYGLTGRHPGYKRYLHRHR